uniref:F-box domain-containing protein n=1 Tax=Tetranychus urticae TaxID=32264 RepID=T1K4G2_TETUR
MLINELPDDCLVTIFDYIQDLQDLINCYKVCEKWSNVIVGRTKRVKYLIDQSYYSSDYVCTNISPYVDVTCLSKLFPNLRIAEFSYKYNREAPIEDIFKLIRNSESLKGIIYDKNWNCELKLENTNLEMLSTSSIGSNSCGIKKNVKQLHLSFFFLNPFECLAYCFPNLERLHITQLEDLLPEHYSDAPVSENLKIVELNPMNYTGVCHSFLFMDSCPALQSAHIRVDCCHIECNDSIKLANLRDLVIQFVKSIDWNDLRTLISKYPNLKHLALRDISLKDEHVKQLIAILPKLALFDIRNPDSGVTQEAADHVRDYCKRYGRSIKFYFKADDKQIESDWPQLLNRPDKICRGFDFMEHCFFKSFDNLPYFLDPMDD